MGLYQLISLSEGYIGEYVERSILGVMKGDTRNSDSGSYRDPLLRSQFTRHRVVHPKAAA